MTDQQNEASTISRSSFKARVPEGFLLFSDAISRLAQGMWGGLRQPLPVQKIKQAYKKELVGFANWRERSGELLRKAALEGELTIYVFASPQVPSKKPGTAQVSSIVPIPVKVLSRLLLFHGSLPDHPIRPSIKATDRDQKLFALLSSGALVVRKTEFDEWYRSERAKGKWSSQPLSRSKPRLGGRPAKQTERLRTAILARVREGAWNAQEPITKLHRLLVGSGRSDVPSCDTLARLVDRMHDETGEPELRRFRRSPRNRT